MTDIKPIVIEGEPWCALDGCPSHVYADAQHLCEVLKAPVPQDFNGYQYCIPALRQQRDEAMRDRVSVELEYRKTLANEYGEDGDIEGLWDVPRDENDTPILGHQFRLVCTHIYGPAAAARLFPDKETR